MTLPRLTAEASAYQTRNAYRTLGARSDGNPSITPATATDRIDGLGAVRDYINRIDFTTLKTHLSLPPARGGHSWTGERADAAEVKYKKWLFIQRNTRTCCSLPAPKSIPCGTSTSSTAGPTSVTPRGSLATTCSTTRISA